MKFVCDRCHTKYSIADEKVRGKILKVRCKTCANVITVRESPGGAAHAASSGAPAVAAQPATHALGAPHGPGHATRPSASHAVAGPGHATRPSASHAVVGPGHATRPSASHAVVGDKAAAAPARPAGRPDASAQPAMSARERLADRVHATSPARAAVTPFVPPPALDQSGIPTVITTEENLAQKAEAEYARATRPEPGPARPLRHPTIPPPPPPPPPVVPDDVEYFLSIDGDQEGPFTLRELTDHVLKAPSTADLHVWTEGLEGWKAPRDVPAVARELRGRRRMTLPPPPPPPPALGHTDRAASGAMGQNLARERAAVSGALTDAPRGTPLRPRPAVAASAPSSAQVDPMESQVTPPPVSLGPIPGALLPPHNGVEVRVPLAAGDSDEATVVAPFLAGLDPGPATPPPVAIPVSLATPTPAPATPATAVAAAPAPAPAADGAALGFAGVGDLGLAASAASHAGDAAGPSQRTRTLRLMLACLGVVVVICLVLVLGLSKRPIASAPEPTRVDRAAADEGFAGLAAKLAAEARENETATPPAAEPAPSAPVEVNAAPPAGRATKSRPVAAPSKATEPAAPTHAAGGVAPLSAEAALAARFSDTDLRSPTVKNLGGRTAEPRIVPSQAAITRVIANNKSGIKTCYQRALVRDSSLTHGKVVVQVGISPSGRVRQVSLDGPRAFNALGPCVRDVVSRWVFPVSSEEYGTEFPLVFQGNE